MNKHFLLSLSILLLLALSGCSLINSPKNSVEPESTKVVASNVGNENNTNPVTEKATSKVGVANEKDYMGVKFCRIREMDISLINETSEYQLTLTDDTVVPPYFNDLDDIVFPAILAKGSVLKTIAFHEIEFNLDGVINYSTLAEKVQSSDESLNLFTLKPSVIDLYINDQFYTEEEIASRAAAGKIYLFFFRNSAYGVLIDSMWQDDGTMTVRYDLEHEKLIIPDTVVSSFAPIDNAVVKAMPLLEAISIAESTRQSRADVVIAQLVYSRFPDVWGDDYYHLSWRIDTETVPYFVNCETGARYIATNSEE